MLQVSLIAKRLNAKLIGEDVLIDCVGSDSRNIKRQQLFVALRGEHFDGHRYAAQALTSGAACVMVEQDFAEMDSLSNAIVVEDTYAALGQLASFWRKQFTLPVIGVTGSNGKTTVKEMLASILSVAASGSDNVLATIGNLNNHIGMPLTLLKLREQHQYAVIEMGMNHRGEIRYLTNIAQPNVVVINNAGDAHIGELGSYQAIAEAKGEILEGLQKSGMAVLNADDVFFPLWKELVAGQTVMTFGLTNAADVSASYHLTVGSSEMQINTPIGEMNVRLPSPGLHNVKNALAATAVAVALNVSKEAIKQGLETYANVKGRLQFYAGLHGANVIDDTYNASPQSMRAAIDVLVQHTGHTILVLGDMGELGADAQKMHEAIGLYANEKGVQQLMTFGELSRFMTTAFGEGAKHFEDLTVLTATLKTQMKHNVLILVKGSRFMKMERVVEAIVQQTEKQQNKNAEEH